MKETKDFRINKGITLIALVITIIVMLILVAVTISMAVNGGLFNYAGDAVSETNNALKAEQQLANGGIEVNNVLYDSIDDYLNNKPSNLIKFKITSIVRWNSWTDDEGYSRREPILETIEYYAEKGMTWEQWCSPTNQKYNPDDYKSLNMGGYYAISRLDEEGYSHYTLVHGSDVVYQGDLVEVSEHIQDGGSYYLWGPEE